MQEEKQNDWIVKPYKQGFPWWRLYSLASMGMVWFIILYQISPEFQAWVNYTFRYWSRYVTYSAEYGVWTVKQAWRKIPNG
jgi:hypothetical protein